MIDIRFLRWPSALEPLKHPLTDPPTEIDIRWFRVSVDSWGRMAVDSVPGGYAAAGNICVPSVK